MGNNIECLSRRSEINKETMKPLNTLRFTGNETIHKKNRRRRKKRFCYTCQRELACKNKNIKGNNDIKNILDQNLLDKTTIKSHACLLK
tara:strand:- start:1259 stop:1525 length:267 start_codon:yes stop_codon:yes gene_type:complete